MAWRGLKKKLFSPDFPIFAPHVRITTTTSSSKQHIESSTNPANFYFEFQKAFYSSSSWAPPSSFLASVVVVLIGKSQFKYPIYNLDNFQIKVLGCWWAWVFMIFWVHSSLLYIQYHPLHFKKFSSVVCARRPKEIIVQFDLISILLHLFYSHQVFFETPKKESVKKNTILLQCIHESFSWSPPT